VDAILDHATHLERLDADVAERLASVEQRQHDVDALRARAERVMRVLDELPGRRAALAADEAVALAARADGVIALREAEETAAATRKDADRLAAERAVATARSALESAERWVADIDVQRARLDDEEELARRDAADAAARAAELGADARDAASVVEWASRERGALIVEHSALAREREAVVREASELLGSVLGEPYAATSVAGLRARLERAFP
jgi:chromosome segregation ATPase